VRVSFPVSKLAVTTGDIDASGRRAVEPGQYEVQVGSMGATFAVGRATNRLEEAGEARLLPTSTIYA
jgi:hypothetical protein